MKWYIGCRMDFCLGDYQFEEFRSAETPKEDTGYLYVIGPFKTKRAAMWAAKYGKQNPHFRCVADAEELARRGVN